MSIHRRTSNSLLVFRLLVRRNDRVHQPSRCGFRRILISRIELLLTDIRLRVLTRLGAFVLAFGWTRANPPPDSVHQPGMLTAAAVVSEERAAADSDIAGCFSAQTTQTLR